MRLIDADTLIKNLSYLYTINHIPVDMRAKEILTTIMEQPTAYSVDKVVEELERHKDTTDLTTVDEEMIVGFTTYQGAFNEAIYKAIEIVKQGGVSDDTNDVCEWTKIDEEGYKNCKCNYDETIPDFFKYCPYCRRKIEVVK